MAMKKRKIKEQPVREEPVKQEPVEKPWFRFWPEGVRKHIDFPEVPLHSLLEEASKKFPEQTAIIYFDKAMSYRELNHLSDKFATALDGLGVRKGDKVAIFLPNIPQFIISYYGIAKIGAIETAISPLYKEREVEHQLNDSEAETIVVLDALYPTLEKVLAKTKVKRVIVTSLKEYMPAATAFLGSLLKKIPSHKVERRSNTYFFRELQSKYEANPPKVDINPKEDLVALQYTGGTTGISKGAMLTHTNLVSNAMSCAEWAQGNDRRRDLFDRVAFVPHLRNDDWYERPNLHGWKNGFAPTLRSDKHVSQHPETQGHSLLRCPDNVFHALSSPEL